MILLNDFPHKFAFFVLDSSNAVDGKVWDTIHFLTQRNSSVQISSQMSKDTLRSSIFTCERQITP